MNRVCIFAHYDKDNIVDDYVIYYLNALKKDFSKIIFVSDSDLPESETSKIASICDYIQAYHHGQYDWGSYKFGYIIAKQNNLLDSADELLLCNDSVYPIVNDFNSIFEKMTVSSCDFWGMYLNLYGLEKFVQNPHLQSWFLLIKKKVISSKIFDDFILSVNKLNDKRDIINNYEIGFTKELETKFVLGFAYSSSYSDAVSNSPLKMLKCDFPFVKTRALRKYFLNYYLKNNIDKKLYCAIKKHLSRSDNRNIFIKLVNTFKMQRKSRKYIITKNL